MPRLLLSQTFLACVCCWWCWPCVTYGNKTTLHIAVFLELSDYFFSYYSGTFDDVLDHTFMKIANRSDILEGFDFKLSVRDTKNNPGEAARQLIHLMNEEPPKVAVIGPTTSASTTLVGQISPLYNVCHFSFMAVTTTTEDNTLYPTMIKVNQATELLNTLRIKLLQELGWTRVGTIVYQHDIAISQMEQFYKRLEENNMTLVTSARFRSSKSFPSIISSFKKFDVRIIMVAAHGIHSPSLFCEAYKQRMFGPKYVWFLSGMFSLPGWMDVQNPMYKCNLEEINEAANGHFTLHNLLLSESEEKTTYGMTPAEEIANVRVILNDPFRRIANKMPWVIDTAWTLALGLNNSLKYLEEKGLSLHDYSYSPDFLDAILKGIKEVQFDGVSGPVGFDDAGKRLGLTTVKRQFAGVAPIEIATYDASIDLFKWKVEPSTLWEDGVAPKDRLILEEVLVTANPTAFFVSIGLSCSGIVMSLVFVSFNIAYRNQRTIRLSSPMLNNVVLFGCILMYSEIFVRGILGKEYLNDAGLCMARMWLVNIAFTLLFGALFAKTYRVYAVFRANTPRTKIIKDYQLLVVFFILLVADCLILVPWTFLHPLHLIKISKIKEKEDSVDKVYSQVFLHCYSDKEFFYTIVVYIYKGLLLLFGAFLAWQTRRVSVPELNDSKFIGMCIYNVVVGCIFGVPLAHVLPADRQTLKFVFESCLIFFCTTLCQIILFVPKIKDRNKVGSKLFQIHSMASEKIIMDMKSSPSMENKVNAEFKGNLNGKNLDILIAHLQKANKQLRCQISTEKLAVSKLKTRIMNVTGLNFYRSGNDYVVLQEKGNNIETSEVDGGT